MVELKDRSIWEVKGFVQPDEGLICYPRYLKVGNTALKIGPLRDKLAIIKSRYENYLKYVDFMKSHHPIIPLEDIVEVYDPKIRSIEILEEEGLSRVEEVARELILELLEAGVSLENIGVTGSILPRLHSETSDVDLIVYGVEDCERAYWKFSEMRRKGVTEPLKGTFLEENLKFKNIDTPKCLELFKGRVLEGSYKGRRYSVKLASIGRKLSPREFRVVERLGTREVTGLILDSTHSYTIPWPAELEVEKGFKPGSKCKIYTLRSRFTEIYDEMLKVGIRGCLEKVYYEGAVFYQLSVNRPGDYVCVDVLEV